MRAIFVDIDWTILSHRNGHKYDMSSIKALKKAQKKGVKVFIATSRPYHSVKQIGLFDLITPDGLVVCNGGLVIYDNQIIRELDMKPASFEKMCEVILKHNLNLQAVEAYTRFLISDRLDSALAVYRTFPETTPDVEDYHNRKVISALLFATEEFDSILEKELPKDLLVYRFHPEGVDVVGQPHKKGDAVKFVLDYLKIDKEDAIAFGDDFADISMFENVGVGVAMANAKDEVKSQAAIVTKEVWKKGVKKALKKLKVI